MSGMYVGPLSRYPTQIRIDSNDRCRWGETTAAEQFLEKEGIKSLFFTGVNTDQCVGGTLTDSFSKGFDCIMLTDGAATTSPHYAQQCFEFNAGNTWGFATTCKALADGVEAMEK
jgi:nicotinamidase-related amidase